MARKAGCEIWPLNTKRRLPMRVARSIRKAVNAERAWRGKRNGVVAWLFDHPKIERHIAKDIKARSRRKAMDRKEIETSD